MVAKLEKLPNEPIIIQTLSKEYSFSKDAQSTIADAISFLEQQSEPTFFIFDMRETSFSLEDVIAAANTVTRQIALFKHPKMREGFIITENAMISLATKGLKSAIFGQTSVKVFKTVEEALVYARQAK